MGKGTSPYDMTRAELVNAIIFMEHETNTSREIRPEIMPYLTRRVELFGYNKNELMSLAIDIRMHMGMSHASWAYINSTAREWVFATESKLGASLSRLTARELSANTSVVKPHDEHLRDLVAQLVFALSLNTAHDYDGVNSDSDVILYLKACIRQVQASKV